LKLFFVFIKKSSFINQSTAPTWDRLIPILFTSP